MNLGNEYLLGPPDAVDGNVPSLRIYLRTFKIPPIQDGAVLGRQAPIDRIAMKKILRLMTRDRFEGIDISDDVVAGIVVRSGVLKKVGWKKLQEIALSHVKPLMAKTEIVALKLNVEVSVGDNC